jgi:hypothetical protein
MNPKVLVKLFTPPQILVNYIKESIAIAHKNFFTTILASLVFTLLLSATYFSMIFLVFAIAYERETQNMLLGYLSLPIVSYFVCGFIRFYLRVVRGLSNNLKILFVGHKRYLQILFLLAAYYTLYILLFKIAFFIKDYDKIMQIRIVLGVVLFFWTISRLIFAPFFVIDADYSAREAMKASFLLTSGKTFKTFSLLTVSFLFLVGGLIFNIALSFVIYEILFVLQTYSIYQIGIPIIILGSAYPFTLIIIAFVMSYDINLKNKYSRRKHLITQAAVIVKRKLEDTNMFEAIK